MQQAIPAGHKMLQEGLAKILYKEDKLEKNDEGKIKPKGKSAKQANDQNQDRGGVFYNPVQEFNRDTSILVIRQYAEQLKKEREAKNKEFQGISVLEALAATGLRSVRYMKEIEQIKLLLANDIDPTATDLMAKNFEFNDIKDKFEISTADAIDLMND